MHSNASRLMRNADGGFPFIYVLPSRAAGARETNVQILFLYLNFSRVDEFRHDLHQSKRRMAALIRIKRRDSDKAMHARFVFEQAISVFSADLDRSVFDAVQFVEMRMDGFNAPALSRSVFLIHLEKNSRPVLRVVPARTRDDA